MFKNLSNRTYILEFSKIGGLLFYFFIKTLAWAINPLNEKEASVFITGNIVDFIVGYISISLLFLLLKFQLKNKSHPIKSFVILVIPGIYFSALLWTLLISYLSKTLRSEGFIFSPLYFVKAFSYLIVVIAFVGLFYLINHWLNLKKQKELTLAATNLANEAQLQMLRYQINPHFLFNALNTIRSMVEEDKTIARNMITELSNFFRYSLSQKGTTDILENEVNAIKNYLEIQKIRFEEKLIISYDIDEKLCQLKIPFFIILPLVENAIKYGLETSKMPLQIKICAKANSHLEISVHNTGSLVHDKKSVDGTQTGIENTKKRLSLHFPDNFSFELYQQDSWVIAQIIIKDFRNLIAE